MRRGLYGKRELRAASLPPAWQVGDRKSFMAARAQALWAILRDHHMNPNELWSSFASIPKIAEKSGVSESGCWKAIKRADGKHIATKRKGKSTYITLYPNIAELRPMNGAKVADLRGERSQNCEHNSYTNNSIKEGSRLKEGKFSKVFIEIDTPQWMAWQKVKRSGHSGERLCSAVRRTAIRAVPSVIGKGTLDTGASSPAGLVSALPIGG